MGATVHATDAALAVNVELEATIADDPYDDHAWSVLADWLLEREDARAVLDGTQLHDLPDVVRKRLARAALGERWSILINRMYLMQWRAGHLQSVLYRASYGEDELLAAFLATPAARLLRSFAFASRWPRLEVVANLLAAAPCARTLRELSLRTVHRTRDRFDAAALAALPRLASFELNSSLTYASTLGRLERLAVAPDPVDRQLRPLFPPGGYPALRDLTLHADPFQSMFPAAREIAFDELAHVLEGDAMPRLEHLRFTLIDRVEAVQPFLDALATSRLLPQLRTLAFDARMPRDPDPDHGPGLAPGALGKAFAHLERVALPPELVRAFRRKPR